MELPIEVVHNWADHVDIAKLPQSFFNLIMDRMFPLPFPHNEERPPSPLLEPDAVEFDHRPVLPPRSYYNVDDLHSVLKLEDQSPVIRQKVRRWIESNDHARNGWMGALREEFIFHSLQDARATIAFNGGVQAHPRPDVICQMAAKNTEHIHFCIKYCQLSPAAYDRTGKSLLAAAIYANNEESMIMLIDMIPGRVLCRPMEVSTIPLRQDAPPSSPGSDRIEEIRDIEAEWYSPSYIDIWRWDALHWLVRLRNPLVLHAMVCKYIEDQIGFPDWFQSYEYSLRICQFIHPETADLLYINGYNISSTLLAIPRLRIPPPGAHVTTMTSLEHLWEDYNDPQDLRRNPGVGEYSYIDPYITSSWHEATKHPDGARFMGWLARRSRLSPYITNDKGHTPLHHAALGNEVSCLGWLCEYLEVLHICTEKQPNGEPDKIYNAVVLAALSRSWNSVKVFDAIIFHSPEDYQNDFEAVKCVFRAIMYGLDVWMKDEPPEYAGFQTRAIPRTGLRLPTPRQLATQKCQAFVARLPATWDGSVDQQQVLEEAKGYSFHFLQHSMRTPRAATRSMTRVEEQAEIMEERATELEAEWRAQSTHPEMSDKVQLAKEAQEDGFRIVGNEEYYAELGECLKKERARTKAELQRREEARSWEGTWKKVKEALYDTLPGVGNMI
ncbi:hypothetical protein N7457_007007 [Penicillium paradoxum]|uniref:uncharacterized protein n=1 Tax=Penicillium paradoxum TaxID=176176 RepID=UPI0025484EAE|nr:uncharacterized protein N7457_007007 [Penicillium paradoxum]KAJ5779287.1 hypothetical protein N7457_007007 [Penicillium paradoxum]